jgi:hypothetical protein
MALEKIKEEKGGSIGEAFDFLAKNFMPQNLPAH